MDLIDVEKERKDSIEDIDIRKKRYIYLLIFKLIF